MLERVDASMLRELPRALPRGTREPIPLPGRDRPLYPSQSWGAPWEWAVNTVGAEQAWPTRPMGTWATEQTITGVPAAWKCLGFIANAAASCAPPIEFDAQGERVEVLSNVVARPWAFLTAHEYWFSALTSVMLFGNFIGLYLDIDPTTGFPRQVMPVHPNDVLMMLIDGLPVYYVGGEAFGWDEVIHVRGYTSPGGLWGVGVIEMFRAAWARVFETDEYGATTFRTAAENSVIIQVDRPELTAAQADAIQTAWIDRHASGTRRPAVLPKSMNVSPLSFTPADAQFLETKGMNIAEIAFMFLLDPSDLSTAIGSGGGALTYANREQREIERLTHAVGPWLRRFEQSWCDLLPGNRTMMFNVERLLRTDTLTRLQATEIALRTGTFTLNDARNAERLPVYGPWADQPFVTSVPEGGSSEMPLDEFVTAVQKIYLGVGVVLTDEEARARLGLPGGMPEPETPELPPEMVAQQALPLPPALDNQPTPPSAEVN